MEIYQASEEFKLHDDSGSATWDQLTPWFVRHSTIYDGYIIQRDLKPFSIVDKSFFENDVHLYNMNIEKQRGGIRLFKTLDAAANAIKQIGQHSFEVRL